MLLKSYEKIITLSKDDFTKSTGETNIGVVLNEKKKASLVLGSVSHGLKYII